MSRDFSSKYVVKNKIGEGTFSEVLKCRNQSTGQLFAAKELKKQYNDLSEALKLPELLILQKLPRHPNVLSLFEYIFDAQQGKLYMVFELMEMSLYELIQSRKRCLSEIKVKQMFYQILKGVEHLHSHGIFHRDIKPENILINKSEVKLADLGSVRGIQSQQPFTEYISTRWYRAPECILTQGCYGTKMDVWACGCVYYEILTSKPLFPGANEVDQLTKIHQVIGTPNQRLLVKLRRTTSRVSDVKFAAYPCTNLTVLLPFTSDGGREILKRMLMYDPEVRSNVRRLLEHRYFNDLREADFMTKQLNNPVKQRSSPVVYSSDNSAKKTKLKPDNLLIKEKKITDTGIKLTTNTWAPSTNTSRVDLIHSKSRVCDKILHTNIKKRSGQFVVKPNITTNSTNKPVLTKLPVGLPNNQQRTTTKSKGDLPSLKTAYVKNKTCALRYRTLDRFLPPILEY